MVAPPPLPPPAMGGSGSNGGVAIFSSFLTVFKNKF